LHFRHLGSNLWYIVLAKLPLIRYNALLHLLRLQAIRVKKEERLISKLVVVMRVRRDEL